ncbi:MAG: DUF4290 domain-containing protein [Solitalea-like symbiont of Tyrophagus putrescentiae]
MFDYNTTRRALVLPEYGRNIDKIVQYVSKITDREKRNIYAKQVIEIMGQLNPHLRDICDFRHKLWDHIYIISEGKLDVDFPYGKPSKKDLKFYPQPLTYPKNNIGKKHYGKTIMLMINKAVEMPDSEYKDVFVACIANYMKNLYITWNKESVTNEAILEDLKQLSKGQLHVSNINLNNLNIDSKPIHNKQNARSYGLNSKSYQFNNPRDRNKKKTKINKKSK